MGQIVCCLLMVQKLLNSKQKFWNWSTSIISRKCFERPWFADNMNNIRFYGYVYDFSVD